MFIKYPDKDCKFLEKNATIINVNNQEWFHFPHWLRKVGDGIFEQVKFEDLPKEMMEHIFSTREPNC